MEPPSVVEEGTFAAPGDPEVTVSASPRGDLFDPSCPTRDLLDRLGSKWVVMIVTTLADSDDREARFSQLQRRVVGISHRMLSQELKRLAGDGLVSRRVEDSVPPRVFYRLTELGLSLLGPITVLREWAEQHMSQIDHHSSTRTDVPSTGPSTGRTSGQPVAPAVSHAEPPAGPGSESAP